MSMETWTPERIEQLRNFATSGLSSSQIAAEIGVTRNAVIGKLNRLGLARGRPAGGSARSCPPRASRPRHSPQRTLLRLMFAQTPSIASGAGTQFVPVESTRPCSLIELAQAPAAGRWTIRMRATLPSAAMNRWPDSPIAPATRAWPTEFRLASALSHRVA